MWGIFMEVKAASVYDYKTIRTFIYTNAFGKENPKTQIITGGIFCIILMTVNIAVMSVHGFDCINFVCFIITAIILFRCCNLYFFVPKKSYELFAKMKNLVTYYVFKDDEVIISSNTDGYQSDRNIKYYLLTKAIETKGYIYIYIAEEDAFVVDISTVTNRTLDDIRQKLMGVLGEKYYICNY